MRTFQFDSLLIFQICSTVLLTVVLITVVNAVHYIPGTYLFYNWKLVPFDSLHPLHPYPSSMGFLIKWEGSGCVCVCVLGGAHKVGKKLGTTRRVVASWMTVCFFTVSVVLVNSINVIFLAPLFRILAERIWQIMWEEFLNSTRAPATENKSQV